MKIKLVLTAIILASFQNFYAQEAILQQATDSVKKASSDAEMVQKEQQLNDEKATTKTANASEDRVNQLERDQKRVVREQNKVERQQNRAERQQNKVINAEKSVSKSQSKLARQEKRSGKIQRKFTKAKAKGDLTPVEVEEGNVKNAKQQLKIKETEEDIEKAKKKLDKVSDN